MSSLSFSSFSAAWATQSNVGGGSLNTNSNNNTVAGDTNVHNDNDNIHNSNDQVTDNDYHGDTTNSTTHNGDYVGGNVDHSVNNSQYNSTTTQNNNEASTKTIKSNPNVNTTNLTTSGQDTCFGSTTGGVSLPGVGIAAGSTYVDENCVMLKQVKLLTNLGLKDAAIILMMEKDPAIAEAILLANPELYLHLYDEERLREAYAKHYDKQKGK